MEAVPMKERPPYPLLTASHRVEADFYQMPRWLLARSDLSLDAKLVYMLLYDRFRLSQKNGWVNEHSEVYLIYPRQELAQTLGVSKRRVIAAIQELRSQKLVWEQRDSIGVPSHLYLAAVDIPVETL